MNIDCQVVILNFGNNTMIRMNNCREAINYIEQNKLPVDDLDVIITHPEGCRSVASVIQKAYWWNALKELAAYEDWKKRQ